MNELDDRLAGDPVWELFPYRAAAPARQFGFDRYRRWLALVLRSCRDLVGFALGGRRDGLSGDCSRRFPARQAACPVDSR